MNKKLLQCKSDTLSVIRCLAIVTSVGAALVQVTIFLIVAISRLRFPFALEWMEGGSLVQVSRILAGKPLYVQPSFEFIPQIYTPLYFYISALASLFLGNSFVPLRFVSIVSSLGIFVLIFVLVRQQTGSKVSGFLASGLFFSTYKLSGYWFDIARVDSLALVLFLISLYFFLRNTPISCGLGGIFLAFSFLTKQTMGIAIGILAIYCLLTPNRNTLIYLGTVVAILASGTIVLDWLHDGWFSYYVFQLPSRHNAIPDIIELIGSAREIVFDELIRPVSFASIIGLLYLFLFPISVDLSDYKTKVSSLLNGVWSKRIVWLLVLTIGLASIGSLWFLASLPSDVDGRMAGAYSFARLLLMTGPAMAGILILIFAIRMVRNPSPCKKIALWIFGDVRFVPRLILGYGLLVTLAIIILSVLQPDIFNQLNQAHLYRILPYLIGPIIVLVILCIIWSFLWHSTRLAPWLFSFFWVGFMAISWTGRLNPGGYYNVFMPAYASISILFGLGIGTIFRQTQANISTFGRIIGIAVLLFSGVQLIELISPYQSQIPTYADMQVGLNLVKRLRDCPGNIYIPFQTYLAELAGKEGYAGVVEMGELRGNFGGKADPMWYPVQEQLQQALNTSKFTAVIQSNQVFRDALSPNYIEKGRIFKDDLLFWPVTGRKIRPESIYIPLNSQGCDVGIE